MSKLGLRQDELLQQMLRDQQEEALQRMVDENQRLGLYDSPGPNPMIKSKSHTATLEEDGAGNLVMPIPEKMLTELGWKVGDRLSWKEQSNGTFVLSKVPTELVLVDTVQTFRMRYLVEVPVGKKDWALDTVVMGQAEEFSQKYLDEQIVSHRVVTQAEALSEFDSDNEYLSSWPSEKKLKNVLTPWVEPEEA